MEQFSRYLETGKKQVFFNGIFRILLLSKFLMSNLFDLIPLFDMDLNDNYKIESVKPHYAVFFCPKFK